MNDRLLTDDELCPNIAETEALEKQDAKTSKWLVDKFNQWADERILDKPTLVPSVYGQPLVLNPRIDELNWAKVNLERLAKEIKG